MREHLANIGVDPVTSTPNELSTYLAAQMKKMHDAVVTSGARADR
jgi:hypothetical protein